MLVDSLSLSGAEAEACLRTELEDIKVELADINSHFVRRRAFRDRVYQALDGDAQVFEDADGAPLDADSALEAVMERLRRNKIDMLSLVESTRVPRLPCRRCNCLPNHVAWVEFHGASLKRQRCSCDCAGWYKANLTKLIPSAPPEGESHVVAARNILQQLNVSSCLHPICMLHLAVWEAQFGRRVGVSLGVMLYALFCSRLRPTYADIPTSGQGQAEASCVGQGRQAC